MTERMALSNGLKVCEDMLAVYYPYGKIEPVSYDNLPYRIRKNIDGEENCGVSLSVVHEDLGQTFIAQHTDFETVYFQDRNERNKYIGEGLIYLEAGDENGLPVVGFTFTSLHARRQGLGTRRLYVMNALSHAVFDEAINSTASPRPKQKSIWERLVEKEVAEVYKWQGTQRYKFIS